MGDRAKAITSGFQLHVANPVDPAELDTVSVLDRISTNMAQSDVPQFVTGGLKSG